MNLLKRLFRRTPTGPPSLPPGTYRLEAWIKTPGMTEWQQRSKLVEVTEPTPASDIGGKFVSDITAQSGDTMWFDNASSNSVEVRVWPNPQ